MKRAVIFEAGRAGLVDAPMPSPKEDWALVKILATPMCTEYKRFVTGPGLEYMGHEAADEVVEVAQPCKVKPGDWVVVMPHYPCGKCDLCVAGDFIHCENSYDFAGFTGSREGSATFAQYKLKLSLDCSGVLAAQRFCLDAVRRKGHVAFVGESIQELPVTVSPDLIRKGICLSGAWHYNLSLFPLIMQVIQNSLVVRHLISHTLPMSQVQQAFEISASQQCAKIILKPWV